MTPVSNQAQKRCSTLQPLLSMLLIFHVSGVTCRSLHSITPVVSWQFFVNRIQHRACSPQIGDNKARTAHGPCCKRPQGDCSFKVTAPFVLCAAVIEQRAFRNTFLALKDLPACGGPCLSSKSGCTALPSSPFVSSTVCPSISSSRSAHPLLVTRRHVFTATMTLEIVCTVGPETNRIPISLPPPYTWTATRSRKLKYVVARKEQARRPLTNPHPTEPTPPTSPPLPPSSSVPNRQPSSSTHPS